MTKNTKIKSIKSSVGTDPSPNAFFRAVYQLWIDPLAAGSSCAGGRVWPHRPAVGQGCDKELSGVQDQLQTWPWGSCRAGLSLWLSPWAWVWHSFNSTWMGLVKNEFSVAASAPGVTVSICAGAKRSSSLSRSNCPHTNMEKPWGMLLQKDWLGQRTFVRNPKAKVWFRYIHSRPSPCSTDHPLKT